MLRLIEGRHANVCVRERRREPVVRNRAGELNPGYTAGAALRGRPLGAVADEDAAESMIAGRMQAVCTGAGKHKTCTTYPAIFTGYLVNAGGY